MASIQQITTVIIVIIVLYVLDPHLSLIPNQIINLIDGIKQEWVMC